MTVSSKSGNMPLRLAMRGSESAPWSTLRASDGGGVCVEGNERVIMMEWLVGARTRSMRCQTAY